MLVSLGSQPHISLQLDQISWSQHTHPPGWLYTHRIKTDLCDKKPVIPPHVHEQSALISTENISLHCMEVSLGKNLSYIKVVISFIRLKAESEQVMSPHKNKSLDILKMQNLASLHISSLNFH